MNTLNTLLILLEKYPNKGWDWEYISEKECITMEFIEKHLDKPLDWDNISRNPNITIEFIEKYPDKPWDWGGICHLILTLQWNLLKNINITNGIGNLLADDNNQVFCNNNTQDINIDFGNDIVKIVEILKINISDTYYLSNIDDININILYISYENLTGISDEQIDRITNMLLDKYGENNIVEIVASGTDKFRADVSIAIMDISKMNKRTIFENNKLFGVVPIYCGKQENLNKMMSICKANFTK